MDFLDLAEVAELLGEPESTILAACERFPDHVPTCGAGARKRFPSIALDVLRLFTDAMKAGSPSEATIHLIETHFPGETTQTFELDEEPEPPLADLELVGSLEPALPDLPEHIAVDTATAEQAATIQGSIEAALGPMMRSLDATLLALQYEMTDIRSNLALTARADDVDLLRAETRGIAIRRADSVASDPRLAATVAVIQSAGDDTRQEMNALRHEVSALRTQLDHREQLAELAGDLAELRAELQRLDWIGRRGSESALPAVVAVQNDPTRPRGLAPSEPPSRSEPNPPAPADESRPGVHSDPQNSASPGPKDDSAPTRITQFAARTPRRMGRSLVADEV